MQKSHVRMNPYLCAVRCLLTSVLIAMALSATGCVRFQHSIVEPSNFAQVVGRQEVRLPYEPLEYRIAEVNERLAVQIFNPGDKAVSLSGARSYLVDPRGASHPLSPATIGPHSYVDLSLPPAPIVLRAGPSFGFGFGFGHYPSYRRFHRHSHFGMGLGYDYPFYDPFYHSPRPEYYRIITPQHWEWRTGDVRLHLSFDRADQPFDHDFVFRRTRVK